MKQKPTAQISFESIEKHCLSFFPEMLDAFTADVLGQAIDEGPYIFFEDYFNDFIEQLKTDDAILRRAARYIEILAQSEDVDILNLTEIGILGGLVNRDVRGISPYLEIHSKGLLIGLA